MTTNTLIGRQIRRVRRRLFWQDFVIRSAVSLAAAFLAVAIWFVLHPLFFAKPTLALRGIIVGSAASIAIIAAFALTWWNIPSSVSAALALDRQFGLKERVTTFLSLTEVQQQSAAGKALFDDVHGRLQNLSIGEKFPIRLPWSRSAFVGLAMCFAAAAFFFQPDWQLRGNNQAARKKQTDAQKIAKAEEQQTRERAAKLQQDRQKLEKEIRELEFKNDKLKLALEKLETAEDGDKTKKKKGENPDPAKDKGDKGKKGEKENPADQFQNELAKGNFEKAAKELDKIRNDIEKKKLNDKQKKNLEKQLDKIQKQLKQIADLKDLKDKLPKNLTDAQKKKALKDIAKKAAELKDLKKLADAMKECKNCVGQGKDQKAAEKMKDMEGMLKKMQANEKKLGAMKADAKQLALAQQKVLQKLNPQNGMGEGKNPGGRRPDGNAPNAKGIDAQQKMKIDPKGTLYITGFRKGGTFTKIPSKDVGEAFQQAQQEAPAIINRQPIPPEYENVAKGYFEKLGKQK